MGFGLADECLNDRAFGGDVDIDIGTGRSNSGGDMGTDAVIFTGRSMFLPPTLQEMRHSFRTYLLLLLLLFTIVAVHSMIETTNPLVGWKVMFDSVILSVMDEQCFLM